MSSELERHHAAMVSKVAQLAAQLVDRRAALAAALSAQQEVARSLEAARVALSVEQRRQRECRLRYAEAEKRAFEHVKGGVEIRSRR